MLLVAADRRAPDGAEKGGKPSNCWSNLVLLCHLLPSAGEIEKQGQQKAVLDACEGCIRSGVQHICVLGLFLMAWVIFVTV